MVVVRIRCETQRVPIMEKSENGTNSLIGVGTRYFREAGELQGYALFHQNKGMDLP